MIYWTEIIIRDMLSGRACLGHDETGGVEERDGERYPGAFKLYSRRQSKKRASLSLACQRTCRCLDKAVTAASHHGCLTIRQAVEGPLLQTRARDSA